jgi:hypothetical protein
MVVHAYNPSIQEAETAGLSLKPPGLLSKFKASLSCIVKPCLKTQVFGVPVFHSHKTELSVVT